MSQYSYYHTYTCPVHRGNVRYIRLHSAQHVVYIGITTACGRFYEYASSEKTLRYLAAAPYGTLTPDTVLKYVRAALRPGQKALLTRLLNR